ncbi:periplasmic heavy metal sensor [Myxococcota bacterium]|nr:periplasmic heavy metal sensor [Myxococcota bacterium]
MKHRAWILAGVAGLLVGCTSVRSSPSATDWGFLGIRNLSPEQRAEIDNLRRDWQREALPKMARVRALNVEIHALVAADSPDVKAIQERLDQVAGLLTEVQKAGLDMVIRMKKVLTPTQNRELQDAILRQGDALFALEGLPGFLSPTQPLPAAAPGAPQPGPGPMAAPGATPPGPPAGTAVPGGAGPQGTQNPPGPSQGVMPMAGAPGGPAVPPPSGPQAGPADGPDSKGTGGDPWVASREANPDRLRPCDGTPGPCRAACDASTAGETAGSRETGKKK